VVPKSSQFNKQIANVGDRVVCRIVAGAI